MIAIWSHSWRQRSCSRCSSQDSICGGIITLDRFCSHLCQPEVCSLPSTARPCSRPLRAAITWLTAWLPPPAGVHTWPMERSSSFWERRSGTSGSSAAACARPLPLLRLFPRTLLPSSQKHERRVSDAPNWWRCAGGDGLSRLPLSSDHYPAAADLTAGRNGPGQFSQSPYQPGLHCGGRLLCGGAGVGGLVLVRLSAPRS